MKRPKERAIRQNLAVVPSSVKAWKLAAELEGVSLSSWVRSHLDPAARKELRRARGDGRLNPEFRGLGELLKRTKKVESKPEPSRALDLLLGNR